MCYVCLSVLCYSCCCPLCVHRSFVVDVVILLSVFRYVVRSVVMSFYMYWYFRLLVVLYVCLDVVCSFVMFPCVSSVSLVRS